MCSWTVKYQNEVIRRKRNYKITELEEYTHTMLKLVNYILGVGCNWHFLTINYAK